MSIDIGIIETPTVRQMFMERIAGMIVSGELKIQYINQKKYLIFKNILLN